MFATLLGALPRPAEAADDLDGAVEAAVRAQEDAGLEPITDGRLRLPQSDRIPTPEEAVEAWRATQSMTELSVKQALPGPYKSAIEGREGGGHAEARRRLAEVATALAEAGCPLVEIEETAVDRLVDEDERKRFRRMHLDLLERVTGTHLSLSIVGGAPDPSTWSTVLELPYSSLAVDLIGGPDNWNLVTRWPGDRGVIAGVESAANPDEPKELLLWAAHYAASTQGRGMARVGLGSAGCWANLTWEAAVRKMHLLGETARLATMPPGDELARKLDPRGVSSRRAALGHDG